jgi:hypothetical protein
VGFTQLIEFAASYWAVTGFEEGVGADVEETAWEGGYHETEERWWDRLVFIWFLGRSCSRETLDDGDRVGGSWW